MTTTPPARVRPLHDAAVIWEQHCCLPLDVGSREVDVDQLLRYRAAGASYVSVNVGYGPHGIGDTVRTLAAFRHHVQTHTDDFVLATAADDVAAAKGSGRLAVGFDLECTNPLEGRVDLVQVYYDLGVRSMLMAYNSETLAGYGCHSDPDGGLKPFGRAVVAEMNRVGMFVDASHCSFRTSMDLFEASSAPVIFSHSVARALKDHERNITDSQMRACAETGGVIGLNGVGIFLGANDASTAAFVRHLDYVVSVVGPQHVGLGLDYTFDMSDLDRELADNPQLFPPSYRTFGEPFRFVAPEQLPEITAAMVDLGYPDEAVLSILGGNFLRLAGEVWKPPSTEPRRSPRPLVPSQPGPA